MEKFWEEKHKNKDDYWISGCNYGEFVLNIQDIDKNISGKKILDIGIGAGHLIKYLFNKQNTMFACDISQIALDNVKDCAKTYLTSELSKIEPVDLAICNLVFQHCTDEEVQRILTDVKLSNDGVFSFQFAFLRENEELTETVKYLIRIGTHHFRSLNTIEEMVKKANKKIIKVSEPIHYYGNENFSWYIVKVVNN